MILLNVNKQNKTIRDEAAPYPNVAVSRMKMHSISERRVAANQEMEMTQLYIIVTTYYFYY